METESPTIEPTKVLTTKTVEIIEPKEKPTQKPTEKPAGKYCYRILEDEKAGKFEFKKNKDIQSKR